LQHFTKQGSFIVKIHWAGKMFCAGFFFASAPLQGASPQPLLPAAQQPARGDRIESIRVTRPFTLEQLRTKPDSTVVVSADGKQSATVGELRRRVDARQRELATMQPGKFLTGGFAQTRSPRGIRAVSLFQQSMIQETRLAQSVRTKPVSGKSFAGVQEKLRSRELVTPQPGISSVNNKIRGYIVSPRSYLTIKGLEFGDAVGNVNVIGAHFPGGGIGLRIVDWRKDEIYVLVPPEIRGVVDHDVSMQVITRSNKTFRLGDGKFIAAREEIVVPSNLTQIIDFRSATVWPGAMNNLGIVYRWKTGESINCPLPGKDSLISLPDVKGADPKRFFLGRGFVVVGLNASWGRTDAGNGDGWGYAGSRTFTPGYGFSDWYGDNQERIDVSWGVWRSHRSPDVLLSGFDDCQSMYQLAVVLSGPAGVAPF
jgi:hypothetical protein